LIGGTGAANTNASPATNASPTNQPAANQQQPINNLLNDLLKPKEKPATNNNDSKEKKK
jgi:hypothetical protein